MKTITLPGGSPLDIPDYAMMLTYVAQEPTEHPEFVARETAIIADQNARQLVWWKGEVNNWITLNVGNRLYQKPLTPKPIQKLSDVFHSVSDKDQTLWFWQTSDGPPIGDPCPDLPPLPTASSGVIIGIRLGDPNSPFYTSGTWFTDSTFTPNPDGTRTQNQDRNPAGTQVHGTSADGVLGTFLKWTTPFGGYWILESQG